MGSKIGASKMINCVVGLTSVASPSAAPVATAASNVGLCKKLVNDSKNQTKKKTNKLSPNIRPLWMTRLGQTAASQPKTPQCFG